MNEVSSTQKTNLNAKETQRYEKEEKNDDYDGDYIEKFAFTCVPHLLGDHYALIYNQLALFHNLQLMFPP